MSSHTYEIFNLKLLMLENDPTSKSARDLHKGKHQRLHVIKGPSLILRNKPYVIRRKQSLKKYIYLLFRLYLHHHPSYDCVQN